MDIYSCIYIYVTPPIIFKTEFSVSVYAFHYSFYLIKVDSTWERGYIAKSLGIQNLENTVDPCTTVESGAPTPFHPMQSKSAHNF